MTDEIRDDNVVDPDELTTTDLAGAGEQKTRRIKSEPLLTPSPASNPTPVDEREIREITVASGAVPGPTAVATRTKMEEELGPLFPSDEANNLRAKWDSVQVRFVDEPRQAVEDADRLIAATMKRLAEIFSEERLKLEHQWDRGDDVSTEDLRLGLRRYRSFFSRLLKV
jgi:hypothetical protein